ncbi:MAG: DegT/DnrJ/EryC1/StrS family aminotransferase, partial [Bacteroidia bacterium]
FENSKGEVIACGSGRYADLAIFSFHPAKHITTGEGGMVTTANEELYKNLLRLRTHGITREPEMLTEKPGGWYYEIHEMGFNYRLTDFQSVLGMSQLTRAKAGIARRRAIAKAYDDTFAESPVNIIVPPPHIHHAYHLYVIQVEDRKGLYDYLRTQEIYAQVHYVPTHLLPYTNGKRGDLPHTEQFYDHCLSLPMYDTLSDEDQERVIECVLKFCEA